MNALPRMTKEESADSRRTYERKEFVQWADDHHNYHVASIGFDGIVLVSGYDERRYNPFGGFTIEDWPDLKAICDSSDGLTHINRDEIVEYMLAERLISQGHEVLSALDAVHVFAVRQDTKCLWNVFEESSFDELIAILSEYIEAMDESLLSQAIKAPGKRYSKVADGPKSPDAFWWRDNEYRLAEKPFDLLVALWNAPGKS